MGLGSDPAVILQIDHLCEHPGFVDLAADWIHREFWADKDVHTPESLAGLFRLAITKTQIPLSLLALVDGVPAGTVNLIENDDDQRTHLRPWLAALYVEPRFRHRGVGSSLVRKLAELSVGLGIERLYLGTDNPGFYRRLGAEVHEQVSGDFAVMRIELSHAPAKASQ